MTCCCHMHALLHQNTPGKAQSKCLHISKLLVRDLPLFQSFPHHTLASFCLCSCCAFVHLSAFHCCRTSFTTSLHLWDGLALFQTDLLGPRPPRPCTIWPTMGHSASFACSVAADWVYSLPVWGHLTTVLPKFYNLISSPTLVHLYSSDKLEMVWSKIPLLQSPPEAHGKAKPFPCVGGNQTLEGFKIWISHRLVRLLGTSFLIKSTCSLSMREAFYHQQM